MVFASESCALDAVGAQFERDLDPGEIVVVEQGEVRSIRENCVNPSSHLCVFEYIYFARPDLGLDAAMGYAQESGIPYGQGFVKNRYIGRTFITPGQLSRELIGADSLGYLSLKMLHQIAPDASCGFCDGCFTGHYPLSLR